MRIALAHPFSWPEVRRGGERYLHDLARYLSGRGADVDVVVGGRPSVEAAGRERLVRVRHLRSLARGPLTPGDTFGLSVGGWLARHRYDVVHALTPTAALAGVLTGHRTVYTVLGHPSERSLSQRRLDAPLFKAAVRRTAAPLALSESAAAAVTSLTGTRPRIVAPGVRTADFPAQAEPRGGAPRVLFPAYAEDRRKGLDLLVRAFALLLSQYPDARLVLAGGGSSGWAFAQLPAPTREQVARATDDLGVGSLEDLPRRYAAATVTVLPSQDEAFGLVLVESLACGTPVVALATGGPLDIVDDEGVGRLSPADDPAALADALAATIALAGRADTPARCARHARRWDWATRIGPLHEEVYAEVSGRWI